ncbi:wall-associated receptor kinase 2-like [Magnolia sinica]|uniref:wall-associated receptor kinase 2-like n=1 Tax=Magnolia sinica TaxID=86752 RepID=UPI0026589170|nr:wall-associated receptor kinase 2-like [Magnolia sinica]
MPPRRGTQAHPAPPPEAPALPLAPPVLPSEIPSPLPEDVVPPPEAGADLTVPLGILYNSDHKKWLKKLVESMNEDDGNVSPPSDSTEVNDHLLDTSISESAQSSPVVEAIKKEPNDDSGDEGGGGGVGNYYGQVAAKLEEASISPATTLSPPKPFTGELEVLDILLALGLMRISNNISFQCYNKTGELGSYSQNWVKLGSNSFTFSETHNKFMAIGCDTLGFIYGPNFTSGCMSFCSDPKSVIHGSCSGIGCCQTSIPKGLKSFELDLSSRSQHTKVWNFNPCDFAFLVEQNAFSFQASYLNDVNFLNGSTTVPVVLDWAIGDKSCEIAQNDSVTYACMSENSHCYNSTNGLGYRCNCTEGYQGNPYLPGGCLDINECEEDHQKTLCQHDCINLPGNYACSCRKGYHGLHDGRRECIKDTNEFTVMAVVLDFYLISEDKTSYIC